MTLCYDGTDVRLHGYVDPDFTGDVVVRRVPLVIFLHFGKWISELAVEAAKVNRLVYDGG